MIICDITHQPDVVGSATIELHCEGEEPVTVKLDLSRAAYEALKAGNWEALGRLASRAPALRPTKPAAKKKAVGVEQQKDAPAEPAQTARSNGAVKRGRPRKKSPTLVAVAEPLPTGDHNAGDKPSPRAIDVRPEPAPTPEVPVNDAQSQDAPASAAPRAASNGHVPLTEAPVESGPGPKVAPVPSPVATVGGAGPGDDDDIDEPPSQPPAEDDEDATPFVPQFTMSLWDDDIGENEEF